MPTTRVSSSVRPPVTGVLKVAAVAASLAVLALAGPAHALKVVTWNLLRYPDSGLAVRQPYFRTVLNALRPDVLIAQELNSSAGKDSLLNNVLNVVEPGQWSGMWIDVLSGEGMGLFWRPSKVSISNFGAFKPPSGPRSVMQCQVRPVGYGTAGGWFRLYSMHLKAGNTPSDTTTRRAEAAEIRNQLNAVPVVAGTNFIFGGDANIYTANEGAYQRFTESQADNDGRCKDPLNLPGSWTSNSAYRIHHTQSTCSGSCIIPDFSGGGLDDRFDMLLSSYAMQDGEGVDFVPGTYLAYGNDGLHFNTDVNGDSFNNAVGFTVATALRNSSDHLPVVVEVQLAAQQQAESLLDFGRVITGGIAQSTLNVGNRASAPADELTYSLSASPGFTAPAGTFTANAMAPANAHVLSLLAGTPGSAIGTATVTSDDPDSASKVVQLSGTVIRHAAPSVDSLAAIAEGTVNFGDHFAPDFRDTTVRVFNHGWDLDQAALEISGASFTGGDGRFSVVDFTPATLTGGGATFTVRFDPAGATSDSAYLATLNFAASDEALPGATSLPLSLTVRARVVSSLAGVPVTPRALRFEGPRPNPFHRGTRFAFELPQPADVRLEIFDLGGRRVATIAGGSFAAGRHEAEWDATDRGVRVPGGLYFARFRTQGMDRRERIVVLP